MAYQPMFSTGGGFNAMNLYESEEERRRRLQEEAIARGELPAGPVAPAEPGPVKQTITFDPVTGEQRMKIEGSVTDLSADNPLTPTVAMPNAQVPAPNASMPIAGPMAPGAGPTPEELMRDEEQRRQYEQMMARPVAPEQQPVQLAAAPAATMTDVTAPTTGAVAPSAMPRTMPTAEDRQYEAQGLQEGPIVREAAMAWGNIANVNRNNPAKLLELAQDPNMPENWRKVYAGIAGDAGRQTQNQSQGEARGQQAMQTGRTDRILQREVEPGSVGFYAKMYLLRALGFEDKYQDEMRKTKTTFQQVMGADNKPYTIETRGDGLAIRGFDSEGNAIDNRTLSAVSAGVSGLKGTEVGANVYMDPTGKYPGTFVLERKAGQNVYREIGTNRIAGPEESAAMRYSGAQGTLADRRASLIQELNLKLQGKSAEEQMNITRSYNQLLVGQGLPPVQPNEVPLIAPQIGGAAPAPATAPTAPAAGPVAPATAPTAPAAGRPAAGPGAAADGATGPVAAAPARTQRPTATQIEAGGVAAKKEAEISAEDIATTRKNQGTNESTVDRQINNVQALMDPTREGRAFESSVGATLRPGFRLIPGTPEASWFKLFDEVKGGQFLAAIKEMKGFGQLSNQEGEAATKAISRLSDAQNEQDFRRAANDYMDIITRAVDRDRAKLGQPPKYATPEATERTRADNEALAWLRANPKDPKAPQVRQRLKERGLL